MTYQQLAHYDSGPAETHRLAALWWTMQHSDDPAREVFAVNCYLDESATDGSTPEAVVAGVLMNRDNFLAFDEAWTKFLAGHGLAKSLHMLDFGLHGCLGNLSDAERYAIFSDAVSLINKHKIYSVGATISHAKYLVSLRPAIREAMSVYGLCFILAAYANHLRAKHNNYAKDIGFLLDAGNPYADHVRGAHAALKEWQKSMPLNVGSLTFDNDDNISALQAADLVAWSVRRRLVGGSFRNGFEPLLGIFDEAHSENAWDGPLLDEVATRLNSLSLS